MMTHLAVHLLEDLELSSLIGPVKGVVALVPVSHHPPALESSLLTADGSFCKLPRCTRQKQDFKTLSNQSVLAYIKLSVLSNLSV